MLAYRCFFFQKKVVNLVEQIHDFVRIVGAVYRKCTWRKHPQKSVHSSARQARNIQSSASYIQYAGYRLKRKLFFAIYVSDMKNYLCFVWT